MCSIPVEGNPCTIIRGVMGTKSKSNPSFMNLLFFPETAFLQGCNKILQEKQQLWQKQTL